MHAPGHRWSTLILVVTVVVTIGCRGSRPFNPLVKVSQEADADLPEIQPPQQRLATAKPRTQSAVAASGIRGSDASPHMTPAASSKSSVAKKSAKASITDNKTQTTAGDRRSTTATTPTTAQRTPTIASGPRATATGQTVAKTSPPAKSAGDVDPAKMMNAFRDYPPEVQREALRRLVAATSQSADKTLQPNSLDSELAKSVLDPPRLPDAKNTVPESPPKRIASEQHSDRPTVAVVTDVQDSITSDDESGVKGRVTDLQTTEIESTVQTISDSDVNDKSVVKPAAAARSDSDESSIARASVERSVPETTPIDAKADAETKQLSDGALYAALLKRMSTAPAGESEADRSSRLIKLRHLMVLSGDPDSAVEQIEGLSEAEQEYLRHHLLGLWTMIDPEGHPVPSRRFTTALPQIRAATKFAAAATDSLDVRSLAFCTEIESYGQIKTFPGNRFDAGQQVILYCEIENFTVAETDDGFETHLQGSYDIYNADNEKVVSQLLPADKQVSANYLRDYFIAYQMHLPQQLSAGTYRLQLTMEDVGGKKYGQSSIPLEIAK